LAWHNRERLEGQPAAEQPSGKRELIVSKAWLQAAALVVVVGFFVLGLLAYRTYESDPPIPARAVDPSGATVYTGDDVREGQKVFLRHGLMEYGSVFGHGAYLGPDFTADYLRRSSDSVRDQLRGDESDSARQETIDQFQSNRYDPATETLRSSPAGCGAGRRAAARPCG
jgi:nitric oxide reductase subunit B